MSNIKKLRLQAKNELASFSDKRYLNSLKAINALSQDATDHLIYVFQLIKEKEFETAFKYYSNHCRSTYAVEIKERIINNSQLAMCCEDFYKWHCVSQLKQYLREAASHTKMTTQQSARVEKFIQEIFNLDHFYRSSQRKDHRPSYLCYPDLNDTPFIKAELRDEKTNLVTLIEKIKQMTLNVLKSEQGVPYVKQIAGIPQGMEHLAGSLNWRSVPLYEAGKIKVTSAETLIAYLQEHFYLADCSPLAPEVMISILEPGTHITPHYGTSNIKHTLHIPILIPEGDLGIIVGGEKRVWRQEQCLLFDDSFLHEAWNRSGNTRIVLILDLWHHDLSTAEKQFLRQVMPSIVATGQNLTI